MSDERVTRVLALSKTLREAAGKLLERGALELARLPAQYERAVASITSGAARLVLHKWREVSTASAGEDLSALDTLRPADFVGVE